MHGSVVGSQTGSSTAVLVNTDSDGIGFAAVGTGPGLVFISGSSNAQGIGVAANMTDFPGVGAAFADFQFARSGTTLAGAGGGTWVNEARQDLQSRTTLIGGSYVVGTCGWECRAGRVLGATNPTLWGASTFTCDGASLHSTLHFLNPSWPPVGAQWVDRLFSAIDAAISAHGKPLRVFVWDHGNDGSDGPASLAYYNNLITLFNRIRTKYGNIGIVIRLVSNRGSIGGGTNLVRTAMESFAMRPENSRVAIVYADECALRDAAHDADDAGGVLGYCEVGNRIATAVIAAANNTVQDLTFPWWGAQGEPQVAGSIAFANPIPYPNFYGSVNGKRDIGLLWYCGAGDNAPATPSGWTQVTGSPVWAGATLDARLHVWTRVLQDGDAAPTFPDVAADGEKSSGIAVIRNSNGLDVNPTTATVAQAAPNAAVSFPSITPVTTNCLIINIMAHGIDNTVPQIGSLTNGGLTELRKRVDYNSNTGSGTGCIISAGRRAAASATGATTGTLSAADSQALMTLAFRP